MAAKFDSSRCWDETVRLLRANSHLLWVLAGLFLFLPVLTGYAIRPELVTGPEVADMGSAMPVLTEYFQRNAGWLIVLQIVQALGLLAIIALLARRRPTVGEAIRASVFALLPLLAAQILISLALLFVASLLFGGLGMLGAAGTAVATAAALLVFLIGFARFCPLAPLIVVESRYNPLTAIGESWQMTKGQTGRLLVFLLLLLVAMLIVSSVAGLLFMLIGALIGSGSVALFVTGALKAAMGAALETLFAAVLTAIYRQLNMAEPVSARAE